MWSCAHVSRPSHCRLRVCVTQVDEETRQALPPEVRRDLRHGAKAATKVATKASSGRGLPTGRLVEPQRSKPSSNADAVGADQLSLTQMQVLPRPGGGDDPRLQGVDPAVWAAMGVRDRIAMLKVAGEAAGGVAATHARQAKQYATAHSHTAKKQRVRPPQAKEHARRSSLDMGRGQPHGSPIPPLFAVEPWPQVKTRLQVGVRWRHGGVAKLPVTRKCVPGRATALHARPDACARALALPRGA